MFNVLFSLFKRQNILNNINHELLEYIKAKFSFDLIRQSTNHIYPINNCNLCSSEWLCRDLGYNLLAANFIHNKLHTKYKYGVDYCIGRKHAPLNNKIRKSGKYCMCYNESVLQSMFAVFEACEEIDNILIKSLDDRMNLKPQDIIRASQINTNKLCQEINDGVSRLLNRDSGKKITRSIFQVQEYDKTKVIYFHGHQLRELVKNKEYCLFNPLPSMFVFGHYHRLFVFSREGIIFLCSGCGVQNIPDVIYEELLMPGTGCSTQNFESGFVKEITLIRA
jgi:hypothetical protein